MSATLAEETGPRDPRETRLQDLDAFLLELDEEPGSDFVEGPRGVQNSVNVAPNRAEGSRAAEEGRVAKRAGSLLIVAGLALIAGAFLALRVSLPLFLLLNTASLAVIAVGVLLLPEGSARR